MTTTRIRAGGFETSVIDVGPKDGDPLLLLHDGAWGASALVTWGEYLPRLSRRFRVIAPDMLGYGAADKVVFVDRTQHEYRIDHLGALLGALGIDRPVHIVGNSFGGAVALRSLARPGVIATRSVTSITGSGGPWRTAIAPKAMGTWDGTREGLARVVRMMVREDFEGFEAHVDARLKSAIVPGHYRSVVAPNAPLPPALQSTSADPWPEQIRGCDVPVLLVRCRRDVLLEPVWADHVHAALPNSRIIDVDAMHAPQIDAADELAPLLSAFLASVR